MDLMEDENDEDLTYLTLLNVFISVSKNIYYENRFFCKVILDSKNNRMIQLGFDKDNTERFHFEDKNQWYVTKSVKILQKFGFY